MQKLLALEVVTNLAEISVPFVAHDQSPELRVFKLSKKQSKQKSWMMGVSNFQGVHDNNNTHCEKKP